MTKQHNNSENLKSIAGGVLVGLGLVLFGVASLGALASLSWIVAYWPALIPKTEVSPQISIRET